MTPPEMKNWVTAGNLIQIGAMLVAIALAWATLDARTDANAAGVADHEQRLRTLESEMANTLGRIDQRLINIERALK